MKKYYRDYVETRELREKLQEKEDKLKTKIVEDLQKQGVKKEETDIGIFTRSQRKSVTYSDAIKPFQEKAKQANEKLKIAQHQDVKSGKAKVEINESLLFTPIKE